MLSTYRVKAADLTSDFLKALKYTYKDREIEIIVTDLIDETDYLLGTAANREQLLGAITDIESEDNLVSLSLDALHSA